MLEFLNLIRVQPISSDNQYYEFVADTFSYIPQLTDNDAGNYWNCDNTIIIDIPDYATRRFFHVERSAIVTIKTSDRKSYNIGTVQVPAKVQISSNMTTCSLIIKCKMLSDPFLQVF